MNTRGRGAGVLLAAATLLAGCSGSDSSPAADGGHSDTVRGWTPPQPAAAAKPLPAVPIVDSASQYAIDGEPGAFQFSASEIEGTNSCNVHPATGDLPVTLTCSANFNDENLPVITWRGDIGPAAGLALTADGVTAIPASAFVSDTRVVPPGRSLYFEPGHTVDFGNGITCTALVTWGLDCSTSGAGFQKVDGGQAVLHGNIIPSPYAS